MNKLIALSLLAATLAANEQNSQPKIPGQDRAFTVGKALAGATVGALGTLYGLVFAGYAITIPVETCGADIDGKTRMLPIYSTDLRRREWGLKLGNLLTWTIPAALCFYCAKKGFEYGVQHARVAISDK